MSETLRLSDVVVDLERRYPPAAAAPWDTAIGLVVGDPSRPVRRMLLAVECTEATAAEAVELDADLLLVHHPFLWGGVTSIAETTTKGRVLTGLVRGGVALYCAHTNADDAPGGVSDSLARTLGLVDLEPMVPSASPPAPAGSGTGRIGSLRRALTLAAFAELAASVLPATAQGIRVSGDLDAEIATVAVCGGSGDSYLGDARLAGVDAYLTADLRHHPATDFRAAASRPFLLDAAHWASEWVWLPFLAKQLVADAEARGATVEVHVSAVRTDAWSATFGAEA